MSVNDYILSPDKLGLLESYQKKQENLTINRRWRKKNSIDCCKKCDEKLVVGDRIIAKSRSGNSKRYHYECAKILHII